MYGYTMVHVMVGLDVFFIRNDVLDEYCDKSTIPSFVELTSFLPMRMHSTCTENDIHKITDFAMAVNGQEKEARISARHMLRHINQQMMKNIGDNTHAEVLSVVSNVLSHGSPICETF